MQPIPLLMSLAALAAVINSSHFLKISVVESDRLIMNSEDMILSYLIIEINLNSCLSNASAIRYRLDSFKDLSNKVVYLVNKYLNYTKEALQSSSVIGLKLQYQRLY